MEEPVFTPSGSNVWNDEQPPPISELRAAVPSTDFTSPVIVLAYDAPTKSVKALPSTESPGGSTPETSNPLKLLAGLEQSRVAGFLSYFSTLQAAGYDLVGGSSNTLVFRKTKSAPVNRAESKSTVSTGSSEVPKKAATVLDEMPTEIEPPGPSAPIAPPSSISRPHRTPHRSRVRRQEEVFSGATRPLPNPTKSSSQSPDSDEASTQVPKIGLFARLGRLVRTVTLTVLALTGGAYVVGVIAEGVGAQAQAQRGLIQGEGEFGPRKRIVLPVVDSETSKRGTRPGIYSTESSR